MAFDSADPTSRSGAWTTERKSVALDPCMATALDYRDCFHILITSTQEQAALLCQSRVQKLKTYKLLKHLLSMLWSKIKHR